MGHLVSIIADSRENPSGIIEKLKKTDSEVKVSQIDVGDYICSDRVCVERKTVDDFISSILDQRIFSQAKKMKENYKHPLIIIEGRPEQLLNGRIKTNAVLGALSSIGVDYAIPILWSPDADTTSLMILTIAKREQSDEKRTPSTRVLKKKKTTKEMQEFLVSGLPDINTTLSKKLLEKFGSPKGLFNAGIKELLDIEGIGKEKAKKIFEVLNLEYY